MEFLVNILGSHYLYYPVAYSVVETNAQNNNEQKPEKGPAINIPDHEKELPPSHEDEPKTPEEIPPFRKDEPAKPEKLPPFREDDPNVPEELPPFQEDEQPGMPEEVPAIDTPRSSEYSPVPRKQLEK